MQVQLVIPITNDAVYQCTSMYNIKGKLIIQICVFKSYTFPHISGVLLMLTLKTRCIKIF